ncbi:MAG: phosphate ABC transporter ATP-binding protein [Candidatus Saccharicenans sp.]|nr:phosphate ABC transporter ATP-binding protein [Candidatus Saccharicenans sp.]
MKDRAIQVVKFSHYYGQQPSLKNLNLDIYRKEILSIIGPAGSGKSTFLTCLNRLVDLVPASRVEGKIFIDGQDIYQPEVEVAALRRQLGMVFATPVPLPMSIYDNLVFGPKLQGQTNRQELDHLVEDCLEKAGLWAEVKDRLKTSALKLSGGQQQRLCLARVLALKPEFILLDEPTSGLDPISTMKIEDTLRLLKDEYTIILVTNNTKQAARVAERTAFFLMGELVEVNDTEIVFTRPADKRTESYIEGKFG